MLVSNSKNQKSMLTSLLVGIGFSTLFTQIFLIRNASVWLRGNEFIVAIIIAAWLMWTAVGCAVSLYFFSNKSSYFSTYYLWFTSIIISVCELILLKLFWACTGKLPGESLDLSYAAGLAVLSTALPCFFSGFASGLAIKLLRNFEKKTVAYFYFSETFGALIAGIAVTFIFIPLQHWWFSITFLLSVPILIYNFKFRILNFRFALIIVLIFAFAFFAWKNNNLLELFAQQISNRFLTGKIVLDIDAPRERFTVTTRNGESAFYINGKLSGSSVQKEIAEEIGWYSFLSSKNAKTALLIGFSYNGLLREFIEKGIKITIPDPEKNLIKKFATFLSREDSKIINSTNVNIYPEDCRTFLKTHNNTHYDRIIQNIGIPEAYSSSRLYSVEWFKIVSQHLSSNGTFTVVLPGSAGYVPDDLARILSRTFKTMKSVFEFVTILPGTSTLLIASNSNYIPVTPEFWLTNLQTALCSEGKTNRSQDSFSYPFWFNPALINDNLNNFRITQFTNACAEFNFLPVHKDLSPFLYGDAMLYSEARFSGSTHKILSAIYNNRTRVTEISIIILFLWVCGVYVSKAVKFSEIHLWILMTSFSAAGFIAEMTLLVRFVIACGSLFYFIGLLFAGFMLGLATATYTIENIKKINQFLLPYAIIMLCFSLFAITFLSFPSSPSIVVLFSFTLNMICGLCVGTCLATMAQRVQSIKHGGMVLYMADLCGAFIGCLLFSIVIPPVLGFAFLTIIVTIILILILSVILMSKVQ